MSYILKKSLGQHFLIDETICQQIADAVLLESPTKLLEVGPGGGAITKYFLEQHHIDFKAVELDSDKISFLTANYPAIKENLIHQSVLEMDKPFDGKFAVVGNFPYNISTEILFKLLDWKEDIEFVVGMFQKEVAQRIAAKAGNKVYGVTSVLMQSAFSVEYLFDVHEESFNPPPKVKSGVIKLKPLVVVPNIKSYSKLRLLVKTAFSQRRKTLRNAVRGLFAPDQLMDAIFDRRAEQLTIDDFGKLTYLMQ